MPAGGHSFQQAYNVQASVDTETMLVVTETVTPHANDKQEIEPALKALEELAEPLGQVGALLADNGYYSETNVRACEAAGVTPYIAMGRERHHPPVEQRWTPPPPLVPDAGPGDGASLIDAGRPGHLRRTEVDGRAGLRNHPIGAGISTVSPQRTGRCFRRMEAGQHGLESEAALQSPPAALIADRRSGFQIPSPVERTPLRMPAQARKCRITAFLDTSSPNRPAKVQSSIRRRSIGAFKSDSLLAEIIFSQPSFLK